MKAAFVCSLPFHKWVLEDLAATFQRDGHDVCWFVHWPKHEKDWLQHDADSPVFRGLEAFRPDVVVAAEYPYPMLRTAAGAPVVTVRHSLASRGNTWEPGQAAADYVVTWSEYDEELFRKRNIPVNALRGGCVWAARFHQVSWLRSRSAICRKLNLDPARPIVLWAPTWNPEFSCGDQVEEELSRLQETFQVVHRRHGASGVLEGPWEPLWIADVLVADVSGLALLALCVPVLPVVQVDPPPHVLDGHPQHNPDGPEWTFRDALGPRVPAGEGLCEMVQRVHREPLDLEPRTAARDTLLGTNSWTRDACRRTTDLIIEALSTGT